MPFGGFIKKENFFGGALVAYQGYNAERTHGQFMGIQSHVTGIPAPTTRNDLGNNTYLFGLFGVRFPESNVSLAGSVSWAKYGAMDGVTLLYPGSIDIKQDGWTAEYKLGVVGNVTDLDRLEFVAGHARFKATHEVTYQDFIIRDPGPFMPYRTEINKDESNEWVLSAGYKRTVNTKWTLGALLAVNWKDHPKIPNYSLANIPRDPGTSTAYNIGLGAVVAGERSQFGVEYIYEPITSNTWAEAGERYVDPRIQAMNPLIPPNFKTVENFFSFSNHIVRAGLLSSTNTDWLDYRFGAQLHFYKYRLNQNDNIFGTSRSMETDWLEGTISAGLTATFSSFQLLYTVQLVLGNGLVSTVSSPIPILLGNGEPVRTNDFLVAPSGDLIVDNITLVTHQVAIVYRLE